VTATSPTTAPTQEPLTDGLIPRILSIHNQANIAAAPAVLVFKKALWRTGREEKKEEEAVVVVGEEEGEE